MNIDTVTGSLGSLVYVTYSTGLRFDSLPMGTFSKHSIFVHILRDAKYKGELLTALELIVIYNMINVQYGGA
jgi:hypothetical protein